MKFLLSLSLATATSLALAVAAAYEVPADALIAGTADEYDAVSAVFIKTDASEDAGADLLYGEDEMGLEFFDVDAAAADHGTFVYQHSSLRGGTDAYPEFEDEEVEQATLVACPATPKDGCFHPNLSVCFEYEDLCKECGYDDCNNRKNSPPINGYKYCSSTLGQRGQCKECPTVGSRYGCPKNMFCDTEVAVIGSRPGHEGRRMCTALKGYKASCSNNNECSTGCCRYRGKRRNHGRRCMWNGCN